MTWAVKRVDRRRAVEHEYSRKAFIGGVGYASEQGCELHEHHQYNGSGEGCFGGAHDWPAVTLIVSFPAGREDLQTELSEKLRRLVDAFLIEKGLEP